MNLIYACALTALIETAFFAVCGYSKPAFLAVCVFINISTNLALNLITPKLAGYVDITYFVYLLEAAVVAMEYGVYALAIGPGRKLALLTLAANIISYLSGLIVFGHI